MRLIADCVAESFARLWAVSKGTEFLSHLHMLVLVATALRVLRIIRGLLIQQEKTRGGHRATELALSSAASARSFPFIVGDGRR